MAGLDKFYRRLLAAGWVAEDAEQTRPNRWMHPSKTAGMYVSLQEAVERQQLSEVEPEYRRPPPEAPPPGGGPPKPPLQPGERFRDRLEDMAREDDVLRALADDHLPVIEMGYGVFAALTFSLLALGFIWGRRTRLEDASAAGRVLAQHRWRRG